MEETEIFHQYSDRNAQMSTQADDMMVDPEVYIEDEWINKPMMQKGFSLTHRDSRHFGNCIPLLFLDGEPLIVIGPDCRLRIIRDLLFWTYPRDNSVFSN